MTVVQSPVGQEVLPMEPIASCKQRFAAWVIESKFRSLWSAPVGRRVFMAVIHALPVCFTTTLSFRVLPSDMQTIVLMAALDHLDAYGLTWF